MANQNNPDLGKRIDNLEKELNRVKILYEKTIKYQREDPEISLAQARKSAEAICKQIYIREGLEKGSKPASKMMLNDLISSLVRSSMLPPHVQISLGTIQAFGNFGTHDQGMDSENITEEFIQPCLGALSTVVDWYFTSYHQKSDLLKSTEKKVYDPVDTIPQSKAKLVESSETLPRKSGAKRFSLNEGEHSHSELENLLMEYFSKEYKTEAQINRREKVKSYLKIFLTEDRSFRREEIKKIIVDDNLWKETFGKFGGSFATYSAYVGNQMSHVSKEFSNKNNDFLRQIINFDSLARGDVKAEEAGAKKDGFHLINQYKDLIRKVII